MIAYSSYIKKVYESIVVDNRFNTEEKCHDFVQNILLNGKKPKCPICGSLSVYRSKRNPGIYKCEGTEHRTSFSIYRSTFLYKTKISLQKWLAAIYIKRHIEPLGKLTVRAFAIGIGLNSPTIERMASAITNLDDAELCPALLKEMNKGKLKQQLDGIRHSLAHAVKRNQH